jgi:cholesterol oxidase
MKRSFPLSQFWERGPGGEDQTGETVTASAQPDAIVIGSGFGGAVAACRLAESGRQVLVLERGRERVGDEFPRLGRTPLREWLWTSSWNGFFDLRVFRRIATLGASGVGGGSHVYANVLLRAPARSFAEGWPAGLNPDTLAPYYERAERMLAVRPLPDTLDPPKSRAYRAAVEHTGAHPFRPNLAVYVGEEPALVPDGPPHYVRDPHGLGVDVMQAPCRHCGECDIGCRYRAKNTLDLNYLAVARQRHGAHIQPLAEVVAVAPAAGGGYRVHYRDRSTGRRGSVRAPLVVIAAGTVNTVELLLRCRDEFGLLPKLSPALGEHFSGNGDFLCAALNTRERLDPWLGPVITTAVEHGDGGLDYYLQEGGFAPDLAFLVAAFRPGPEFLGKFLRGPVGHAARLRWFYEEVGRLAHNNEALARALPANTMIFLGMGRDASDGRLALRKRLGRRPHLEIEWDHTASRPLIARMEAEFRRITAQLGGTFVSNPLWSLLGRLITVHPLGGCALADDPSQGVLSPYGEVWGYPNLFVTDGAAMPRAIGPNPSLTISALAERSAEYMVKR